VFSVCVKRENGRLVDVVLASGSVGQGIVSVDGELMSIWHHVGSKSESFVGCGMLVIAWRNAQNGGWARV
jgi:hypothetical protein